MRNIGIIGIRGYRVVYSGFETFVRRLVDEPNKDHYYYLFSRSSHNRTLIKKSNFETVYIPTINNKYFGTICYAWLSDFSGITKKINVILNLGLANAFLIFIQRLFSRKVIVNVDGLDWQRKRWNSLGKLYLKMC